VIGGHGPIPSPQRPNYTERTPRGATIFAMLAKRRGSHPFFSESLFAEPSTNQAASSRHGPQLTRSPPNAAARGGRIGWSLRAGGDRGPSRSRAAAWRRSPARTRTSGRGRVCATPPAGRTRASPSPTPSAGSRAPARTAAGSGRRAGCPRRAGTPGAAGSPPQPPIAVTVAGGIDHIAMRNRDSRFNDSGHQLRGLAHLAQKSFRGRVRQPYWGNFSQ